MTAEFTGPPIQPPPPEPAPAPPAPVHQPPIQPPLLPPVHQPPIQPPALPPTVGRAPMAPPAFAAGRASLPSTAPMAPFVLGAPTPSFARGAAMAPPVSTTHIPVVPPTRPAPPTAPAPKPKPPTNRKALALVVPLLIGACVSVAFGVYGRLHSPSGIAVNVAGFSSPVTVKVWLVCGAALLAFVQLLSAMAMWGKLGSFSPSWASTAHRWSGRLAFLLTVPVAVHCLYALGFQTYSPRVLIHSLLGCFFYGAFTAKMLLLPKKGLPGWTLPVIGGAVFTALIGLWLSSSVWFFATNGVQF